MQFSSAKPQLKIDKLRVINGIGVPGIGIQDFDVLAERMRGVLESARKPDNPKRFKPFNVPGTRLYIQPSESHTKFDCFSLNARFAGKQFARFEVGEMFLGKKKGTRQYIAFEFSPANVENYVAFQAFSSYLRQELGEQCGYRHLFEHGRTQKLDLALDVRVPLEKLLFFQPGAKKAQFFWKEEDPHAPKVPGINLFTNKLESYPRASKGTFYIGRRKSTKSLACYDRTRKFKEVEGKTYGFGEAITRIERRLYDIGIQPDTLPSLPNALDQWIIDVDKALALDTCPKWQRFIEHAQDHGLNLSLDYVKLKQGEYASRKYRERLEHCLVGWFDPAEVWKQQYQAALMLTKPCLLDPLDTSTDTIGKQPSEDIPTKTIPKYVQDVLDAVAKLAQGTK